MAEMTAAQSETLAALVESYGEGEVTGRDDDSGAAIFAAGEQQLLVAPDGSVTDLREASGHGRADAAASGTGPETAPPPAGADTESAEADASPASALSANFPVDSYREAAIHLRRPFTAAAVKWKVQAGTLVVPYVDARLVIERLNLVVPHLWHDEYEPLAGGRGLLCHLTIDGITRRDVGEGYQGKGLYSDAFKRAAVKFGVGVSLYALPKVYLDKGKGQLKERKDRKGKVTLEITDKGRAGLDAGYQRWLENVGETMFGPVLDHGDVYDSYGELVEADPEPVPEAPPEPQKLTDAKATALIERAEKLHQDVPRKSMPKAAFRRQLESAWHSHEELERFVESLEKLAQTKEES